MIYPTYTFCPLIYKVETTEIAVIMEKRKKGINKEGFVILCTAVESFFVLLYFVIQNQYYNIGTNSESPTFSRSIWTISYKAIWTIW